MAKTQRGETLVGIAASDSPTSITLRMAGGIERTLLRKGQELVLTLLLEKLLEQVFH